ncbi:MAG: DUF4388 domain-containing protein [Acidobacteriota bacterium]
MNLDGDLSRIRLPKVLLGIGAQKGTGILTVQGEDDIVAVSFVEGAVVTADALNQTVEDGLGRVLESKGWLHASEFELALGEYQGGSTGSLGEYLIERSMIDRGQLLEALREQTLDSMMDLLTWKTGEFKFYSGDEVSYEDGLLPILVDELLVEAIDRLGEKVGLVGSVPSAASAYRQVPPRGQVQVFGRDGDGMTAGIWITEAQADFLARVDGKKAASEIARELGLGKHPLQFTLYYLTQYDLIESSGRRTPALGQAAPPPSGGLQQQQPSPAEALGPPPSEPAEPLYFSESPQGAGSELASPLGDAMLDPDPDPNLGTGELRAEIFRPPDDLEESRSLRRQSRASANALLDWAAIALAAALLMAIGLALSQRPLALLLPFPWQDKSLATAERQVREAQYRRIDRAARTYFLLEARYPEELSDLEAAGALDEHDLEDPAGHLMNYSTDGVSYSIALQRDGREIEGLGTTEGITGDFFVDPQFLSSAASAEAPLVLLD